MADEPTVARPALSAPQRAAIAVLRGYQLFLSPLFTGSCRFVPSCSAYAVEAVSRFGVWRGSWLALRRLGRCRPLAAHGFDPVPASPAPARDGRRPRGHVTSN